jgi:hypothetical protein
MIAAMPAPASRGSPITSGTDAKTAGLLGAFDDYAIQTLQPGQDRRIPIIVGGGQLAADTAARVGADGWRNSAGTGVTAIAELIEASRRPGGGPAEG